MSDTIAIGFFSVSIAFCIWGFIANQITFRRIMRETNEVYRRRVKLIDRGGDYNQVPYPVDGAYDKLLWRTFFLRQYGDILPLTGTRHPTTPRE